MISSNSNLFYGRAYHDAPVTCIVTQTVRNQQKLSKFKGESDDGKKVVTIRRPLFAIFAYIILLYT